MGENSFIEKNKTENNILDNQLYTDQKIRVKKEPFTLLSGHLYTRTYGVTIHITDAQKEKTSRVQFETGITLRRYPEEKCFEYTIKRDKIFINKRAPKKIVEILSIKTQAVLYPLQLKTTFGNELLDIINYEEIITRWKKVKQQLQKEYTGKAFTQYITKFETNLLQKHYLLSSFKQEVFYTLLFHNVYKGYNTSLEKKVEMQFPILSFKNPLIFKATQKINNYKTYYNTAHITLDSKIKNNTTEAILKVEYDLDSSSFLLQNTIAECSIKHQDTLVKKIKATVYHLREKPTVRQSFDDMEDDLKRRKKALKKEENKNLTTKQRFYKWLNS